MLFSWLNKSGQPKMEYAILDQNLTAESAAWLESALLLLGIPGMDMEGESSSTDLQRVLLNTCWELIQLPKGMPNGIADYAAAVQDLHKVFCFS